jgi:hypothetical protein
MSLTAHLIDGNIAYEAAEKRPLPLSAAPRRKQKWPTISQFLRREHKNG